MYPEGTIEGTFSGGRVQDHGMQCILAEEAQSCCFRYRFPPAMHRELTVDAVGVALDGAGGDVEAGGDLHVGEVTVE